MQKFRVWGASLITLALLLPASAWAAPTTVDVSFGLGDCTGTASGGELEINQNVSTTCNIDVFMDSVIGDETIATFNILLSETDLNMKAFVFTDTNLTPNPLLGFPDSSPVTISAVGAPTNGVRIGTLEVDPSILGGLITLGGNWVQNEVPFSSNAYDNAGATLAVVVVPEPSTLGLLLTGILGLASGRLRDRR